MFMTLTRNQTMTFPIRRFQSRRYRAATMKTDRATLPHTRRVSLE